MRNVLIIKTGHCEILDSPGKKGISLGDVLRSTCLLKAFKEDSVDWLVSSKAIPLLKENPSIRKLFVYEHIRTLLNIDFTHYDLIINLEKDPPFEVPQDQNIIGFTTQTREVSCTPTFREILHYTSDTETRKVKEKSLERLLVEAVGKKWLGQDYDFTPPQSPNKPQFDIALNWSVGNKFPTKAYDLSKWKQLENDLLSMGYTVQWQKHLNDLQAYIQWLQLSQFIITSDSLGLHLAVAMRKPFAALFGPTLSSEFHAIDKKGEVLRDENLSCLGCYKKSCDIGHLCLENISPEEILKAVKKYISPRLHTQEALNVTSN